MNTPRSEITGGTLWVRWTIYLMGTLRLFIPYHLLTDWYPRKHIDICGKEAALFVCFSKCVCSFNFIPQCSCQMSLPRSEITDGILWNRGTIWNGLTILSCPPNPNCLLVKYRWQTHVNEYGNHAQYLSVFINRMCSIQEVNVMCMMHMSNRSPWYEISSWIICHGHTIWEA